MLQNFSKCCEIKIKYFRENFELFWQNPYKTYFKCNFPSEDDII